ncbi:hypothetical protein B296_00040519, partial [Ensete ventricosum]
GIAQSKKCGLQNEKLKSLSVYPSHLAVPKISKLRDNRPNLFVRSLFSLLTFLLRLLATKSNLPLKLALLPLPSVPENVASFWLLQIRRSLLNEDESGFQKAKRPIYYDDGLEQKTRQTLNSKISQLNNVIDNISSRLRGRNNVVTEFVDADSEVESAM